MEYKRGDKVRFKLDRPRESHRKEFVRAYDDGFIATIIDKGNGDLYWVDLKGCPHFGTDTGRVPSKNLMPLTISKGV